MRIDIRADVAQAKRFLTNLSEHAINKAAARAINDALVTVRAEGSRLIKQEHPELKISDIKSELVVHKAWPRKLSGSVDTHGRTLSLIRFGARQTSRGVSARIGKGRRQVIVHKGRKAFKVEKYGDVFVRREEKGRQIRRFRGPSMPGVFRARSVQFKRIGQERWVVTFPNRLKYEMELAKRQ